MSVRKDSNHLVEIALLFLKLGTIAFGGPAAHIAMMENEVVHKRQWITREKFLDLLGASNLIPGPNSTELAIHIGHLRGGWRGLIIAGFCFITPAMLIVLGFAWAYTKYGTLPQVAHLLYGIKPIIIAIVVQALWNLAKTAFKTKDLIGIGVLALALAALGVGEVTIMIVAALLVIMLRQLKGGLEAKKMMLPALFLSEQKKLWATAVATTIVPFSTSSLFWFFLKIGSVLYGSGYVLLAFLRSGLVEKYGWLTEAQLLDAIAVGQVTPGPVFTTATFIGYLLGGTQSALVATLGIFLPSFVFVALSAPLIPKLRQSKITGAFLDGVNTASLALMAFVTWELGNSAITDLWTLLLAFLGIFLLVKYKINATWLIAVGALVGLTKHLLPF